MRPRIPTYLIVLTLAALTVSACSHRDQAPTSSTLSEDDDTFCRANNVAPGSQQYVNCIKDRDVQRSNAITRADRAQRNLGEFMMNNPATPR